MVNIIKETLNIELHNIGKSGSLHKPVNCRYCIFYRPVRTETIAVIAEPGFTDWLHDLLDTLLYQPVPDARDSQRSGASVGLWDFFPSYTSGGVAVFPPFTILHTLAVTSSAVSLPISEIFSLSVPGVKLPVLDLIFL